VTQKINTTLESHPQLGWVGSVASFLLGTTQWLIDHADSFTKLAGFAAAFFGVIAGWYTLRIQRRAWQKTQREDRTP
jgi:hypothetical protein